VASLLVDRPDGGIAVVTLDRSERKNALSIALRDEISDALDDLEQDEDLKVVVITGAGDVFSAGFDLKEFDTAFADQAYADELWASSDRFHHRVLGFPLPTIAAVNGAALAGGFDLAVLCDLRIASTTARFAHPEQTFGDVVYGPLHDLVGGAIARELCFTGRSIDADEALRLHLVSRVVEPEALLSNVLDVARQIAAAPRANLIHTKAKSLQRAGIDPATPTLDL
jgi:enoyl-CoA hydratase